MAVVAYLRVSTEKQFLENQREEIIRFAEKNGLSIDRWYMETVSGKVSSKERKLAGLLDRMKPGDSLIITEISRLSRTLLEIMTILNSCIKRGVVLYSTKEGYVFQNDINSKVLGFAFGLMAEIERNLISMRTKEALERRRKEGKHLGRKKGDTPKMKILYANKRKLVREHQRGESCAELARQMGVSRTTMFRFLRRYCAIRLNEGVKGGIPFDTLRVGYLFGRYFFLFLFLPLFPALVQVFQLE